MNFLKVKKKKKFFPCDSNSQFPGQQQEDLDMCNNKYQTF